MHPASSIVTSIALTLVLHAMTYVKGQSHCKNQLHDRKCRYLALHSACKINEKLMKVFCPRTCGFCKNGPIKCSQSIYGCCHDGVTTAQGKYFWGCKDKCENQLRPFICETIKKSGFCKKTKYSKRCKITCNVCRKCEDTDPKRCKYIKKNKLCKKLKLFTLNSCRKTCQTCGQSDPCAGVTCEQGNTCLIDAQEKPYCSCYTCTISEYKTTYVCGRNNVTYSNLCTMKQALCKTSTADAFTVKNYGKCEANDWSLGDNPSYTGCENSKYGCCLDGKTSSKDLSARSCPEMCPKDCYKTLCQRFVADCGNEINRHFMKTFCPRSCLYCIP